MFFFLISLQVKVEIVVQFFKVGEIDTLKEQYNADVIVKAKWREPSFDGKNAMVRFVIRLFRLAHLNTNRIHFNP